MTDRRPSPRPSPDVLLARLHEEDARARRGKLTLYFGAAPGVGKTYAMLEGARIDRAEGRDVVAGIVETHGRYDTAALLLGLEVLPRRKVEHRGIVLEELDLDAALARHPGLLLVDELAHTNAPGSRHAKRWQDVEELLEAGIDVFTTLNVQHLESLNDVVAQITQVIVRETVPDVVFERADDVRVIDIPIDALLERLRGGKVYVPEQARLAGEGFFREGNLIALRELALRLTAQRVDAQMRRYREQHGIDRTWAVGDRLLVCVSASPTSEQLIRSACRMAASLHADWIAANVELGGSLRVSARDRERVGEHLRLAQSLNAETVTLEGENGAREILDFARSRNVTRVLVGKPTHPPWHDRLRPSFLDHLVRESGEIDVHVLSGDRTGRPVEARAGAPRASKEPTGYVAAVAVVALSTGLAWSAFQPEQLADVVMIHLLGIILVSMRWGLGPSLCAAVLAVMCVDFFFVPPRYTFAVSDGRHLVTFAVMFLVAAVISGLTKRVRSQAESARERERRTASLYSLSRSLSSAKTAREVGTAGAKHLHDVFGVRVAALAPDAAGKLAPIVDEAWTYSLDAKEGGVADWVWHHGKAAGLGTDTLPSATSIYMPLEGATSRLGVLGLQPVLRGGVVGHHDRQQLDPFVGQIATALERTRLASQAQEAQLRIEREQLRNSLLSSVSHDLRTPLAVITGTASTLLQAHIEPAMQRELTESILTEAARLNRLVRNLLDMTRLEAGAVEVKKEWQPLEEAVGAALERVTQVMKDRTVKTDLPEDLALVPYDSILLQQVLVNLLENAAKYTPNATVVLVRVVRRPTEVEIIVADRGPGLPPGEESKIFEKFYRAEKGRGGGVGLGLTICRGIVTAHGGAIWAENREGGGCAFHFTLPIEGEPPTLDTLEPSVP